MDKEERKQHVSDFASQLSESHGKSPLIDLPPGEYIIRSNKGLLSDFKVLEGGSVYLKVAGKPRKA